MRIDKNNYYFANVKLTVITGLENYHSYILKMMKSSSRVVIAKRLFVKFLICEF